MTSRNESERASLLQNANVNKTNQSQLANASRIIEDINHNRRESNTFISSLRAKAVAQIKKTRPIQIIFLILLLSIIAFWIFITYRYNNATKNDHNHQIIVQTSSPTKISTNTSLPPTHCPSKLKANRRSNLNPYRNAQCKNAILIHDNITMNEEIYKNARKCEGFKGVFTREGLAAYINGSCPYQHQSIRTHESLMTYLKEFKSMKPFSKRGDAEYKEWYPQFPIYYMIPKSGSSTMIKMLRHTNKYKSEGDVVGGRPHGYDAVRGTNCAFTMVRNPIDRLISGYYTINVHLWRHLEGSFANLLNETFGKKPGKLMRYMSIKGEPQRFRMFVREMIESAEDFTLNDSNGHIISASSLLSYWLGDGSDEKKQSDMHFIGKIEHFKDNMTELMHLCDDYFNEDDVKSLQSKSSRREMKGFGWSKPSSWVKEWQLYGNWVDWMDLTPILAHYKATGNDGVGILPPVYYLIDEGLYNEIVGYYIQDLVCFDYESEMSYQHFKNKRDEKHLDIYQMYKNATWEQFDAIM